MGDSVRDGEGRWREKRGHLEEVWGRTARCRSLFKAARNTKHRGQRSQSILKRIRNPKSLGFVVSKSLRVAGDAIQNPARLISSILEKRRLFDFMAHFHRTLGLSSFISTATPNRALNLRRAAIPDEPRHAQGRLSGTPEVWGAPLHG